MQLKWILLVPLILFERDSLSRGTQYSFLQTGLERRNIRESNTQIENDDKHQNQENPNPSLSKKSKPCSIDNDVGRSIFIYNDVVCICTRY
jgi:hypothetical protein